MIEFALYRGRSPISRLIRWFTWSEYSHVSVVVWGDHGSKTIYEAWHKGGVRKTTDWLDGHQPKTRIDLYAFRHPLSPADQAKLIAVLEGELGKPYDWRGVFSFLLRRRMQRSGAWFCSEYASQACLTIGRMILACAPWRISPGMFADSPILKPTSSLVI